MSETPNDTTGKPRNPNFPDVEKGRSGPRKGNLNAGRHYLLAGRLPARLAYIEHRINNLRRHLEAAITAAKGDVSITDAAAINSACKWERHGMLAQNWLRKEADKLTASDRLRFSEAIAKASDNRDRNIRALGLDAPPPPESLTTYIVEADQRNSKQETTTER